MASNGVPVSASVASIVQGSQVSLSIPISASSGKSFAGRQRRGIAQRRLQPPIGGCEFSGFTVRADPAQRRQYPDDANQSNLQALIAQLNKYLNDSGRPDQYRVDPQSGSMIQEVNPANGAVIAEFAASEFPALARSVGASGLLVDSLA
jgi:hypothetical protein